jgi:hypothetical protein
MLGLFVLRQEAEQPLGGLAGLGGGAHDRAVVSRSTSSNREVSIM